MQEANARDTGLELKDVLEKPVIKRQHRSVRPAMAVNSKAIQEIRSGQKSVKCLFIDLNNLASFPTLAIGLLTASLRNKGHQVKLLSPLAYDVPATQRERQENVFDNLKRRIHLTDNPLLIKARNISRYANAKVNERPHSRVMGTLLKAIEDDRPDVILLSAYLQHFKSVKSICKAAKKADIPVLLGGPMFNIPDVAGSWCTMPGLTAVVGGEMDKQLPELVEKLAGGEDISCLPGVITAAAEQAMVAAPPLRPLDSTPIPDFTDFPWDRYPVRIIPVMTGRGCQWDKCLFCSDVISANGREFRTRSVENVLLEMQELSRRHNSTNFLFLDLKLNSWPEMMRGIAKDIQKYVQGAEWVGTVHVDLRKDNGLSRRDLKMAVEGGMRRISFGLESGSQRLLDAMNKGCSVERNGQFIRDAFEAGLSVRCTMFKGFPGETAEDMEQTADFLEEHAYAIDRIRFNDFTLHTDTPIWREMMAKSGEEAALRIRSHHKARARTTYLNPDLSCPAYRKAKNRALKVVYAINSKKLRESARQFDGLM